MTGGAASLYLAARIALALALGWAALAKAASGRSLRGRLRDFGVPAALAGPVAVLLPATEAAVAVALVAGARSSWPGWVAVGLLGGFTLLVLATVRRDVPCPCFGASEAPVGARAVVRNLVLLAVAVFATGPVRGAEPAASVLLTLLLALPVLAAVAFAEGAPAPR